MVNGLISQFTTSVTTRPLGPVADLPERAEVDAHHHRIDIAQISTATGRLTEATSSAASAAN